MLSEENYIKAAEYLKRIKGILATGQFKVQDTEKNNQFDAKYGLRHDQKKEILQSLTADDCVAVERNINPFYPDAEVYKFIKNCDVLSFGEELVIKLYIKSYLEEYKTKDYVVVISFHEEGMFK